MEASRGMVVSTATRDRAGRLARLAPARNTGKGPFSDKDGALSAFSPRGENAGNEREGPIEGSHCVLNASQTQCLPAHLYGE